ncbi:MAG: metallophosphatase family protein [Actinomycetota bacterium]|nr:metallophosphatase family protein [Actinomycetota bacterium]
MGGSLIRAAVIADTHVRAGTDRPLSERVYAELASADVILHAGDILVAGMLDELASMAPVHAVLGNNDHGLEATLPETLVIDLAGVPVGMVHDSGPTKGRAARMRRRFPHSAVVVFGHSHQPVDELGVDGQRLFNPGSPTQRRRAPTKTMGWLELRAGEVIGHEIVNV